MKPFNWSRAAFGRDAENDMFNSNPLQCGEGCDDEHQEFDANDQLLFCDEMMIADNQQICEFGC